MAEIEEIMHFAKLLLPTDFSAASLPAFELAAYSRKMEGSEIILLHVLTFKAPLIYERSDFKLTTMVKEMEEDERKQAETELSALAKKYFHDVGGVRCEVVRLKKSVGEEICDFAEKAGCDVIVVGAHGHTALASFLLGSVTQRVLLRSTLPVLVVPPPKSV